MDTWAKSSSLDLGYSHSKDSFSFLADEDLSVTETDIFSWLPDCAEEYSDLLNSHGQVSVKDNYALFCLTSSSGTPYGWSVTTDGEECLELEKISNCSAVSGIPIEGGSVKEVYAYKAVKDGCEKITYDLKAMYTDGEVIETQTADCAVFDNAQAVLLSGQMRITLEDYDTGETIPLSEGSMPVISTNISYDTPNGTVSTGPILAMDPDPAIFDNIGGFFGADSFSFWLSSQQLPEGYVIPGNEQSIGYYDGTILPEGCMTVDRYDNGSANVVFRLKHIVIGDVNGDGEFNIADAVSLQKWLLAVPDAELACWKAGDLDGNLKLNVFDLILMKQVVAEQCKDYVEPDVRSTWPSEMMVVKDSIEMYQGPDTSYPVVATIPGTFVKRLHEGSVQDE